MATMHYGRSSPRPRGGSRLILEPSLAQRIALALHEEAVARHTAGRTHTQPSAPRRFSWETEQ